MKVRGGFGGFCGGAGICFICLRRDKTGRQTRRGQRQTQRRTHYICSSVIDYGAKVGAERQVKGSREFISRVNWTEPFAFCKRCTCFCSHGSIIEHITTIRPKSSDEKAAAAPEPLFKINGSILGAFQILYLPPCTFSLIKGRPAASVPFGVKQKSTPPVLLSNPHTRSLSSKHRQSHIVRDEILISSDHTARPATPAIPVLVLSRSCQQ